MGLAVETLGFHVANPSSTFTAVTMATGDAAVVRTFRDGSKAVLEHIARQGATAGAWRVKSPTMHDNNIGLTFVTAESPTVFQMPDYIGEPMTSGDTLTIQGTGGTNETEVGTLTIYYQDVNGLAATYYGWNDIAGAIEHLYTNEVDCSIGGTAGVWASTLFNATSTQQKADRKYAILGYTSDTALCSVAFRGGETGNVRIGGPGPTTVEDTADWFIQESNRQGTPHIPVVSANNFGNTNVDIITTATSGTAKIVINMALLAKGFGA